MSEHTTLRLGSTAPDFEADTSNGPISFHEFIGDNWVVLFSHPHDFTPVCTTELGVQFTIRSVFVIDPKKKIRLILAYPASTGRNTAEVLRVVDSLQTGDKYRVTTPINWVPGDDVIVHPTVSNEEAKTLFPKFRIIKPYLRLTPLEVGEQK